MSRMELQSTAASVHQISTTRKLDCNVSSRDGVGPHAELTKYPGR